MQKALAVGARGVLFTCDNFYAHKALDEAMVLLEEVCLLCLSPVCMQRIVLTDKYG